MKNWLLSLFFLGFLCSPAWALPTATLQIVTPKGPLSIEAELARTPEEQQTGLMHRRELGEKSGMLFVLSPPRALSMWMKNTLIPLDMLFLDAEGRIQKIHENAVPQSLTPIASGGVVGYVLELPGGFVARHGLSVGQRVIIPASKE